MTITVNQISFSPSFLRGECSLKIDGVGVFELNYLEMRELESKIYRLKDYLDLEKKRKTPKQYIKENIVTAYNSGFEDVRGYIPKFLNFLDNIIYDNRRKKIQKEEKNNLIEELKNSELFSDGGIKNFDVDNRVNEKARKNNEFYKNKCRQEVKDVFQKSSPKKFSNILMEKMNNELDYDFLLEGISLLGEDDKKLGGMLIENLSYELNNIYHKDYFDNNFSNIHGHKYENEYGSLDKTNYGIERDKNRIKSLETVWKGIEMIEEKTGLLCCGIDGSGEFIDVDKIKKKFKGEIKSWMFIHSDGNGNLSENGEGGNRVGIMSLGVFDGTNVNLLSKEIKDLKTYRLDRKLPKDFLFEGNESDMKEYVGFDFSTEEDISDILTI